jgi:hypothetical protein
MEAGVRVQPDADRLLNAIADDDDTEVLDAAAGCEFVDDRIRLIE